MVDGHFGGSCAGCRYSSAGYLCSLWKKVRSTEESVEAAADGMSVPQQKGKSPSIIDGGVLTLIDNGPTHPTPARITRVRFRETESPPRSSQTISRGRAMSPVCVASPAPEPRIVSHLRSRPRPPTPDESLKGIYDWELRLARMQSRKARIASRRRHEAAVAAINQVEVEEEEAERRERGEK